jgi:hypothetical protein
MDYLSNQSAKVNKNFRQLESNSITTNNDFLPNACFWDAWIQDVVSEFIHLVYLSNMVIRTCWETEFINYILLWKNTEAGCWLHQTQFQNEGRERLWMVTIERLVYMQEFYENKFKTANRRH